MGTPAVPAKVELVAPEAVSVSEGLAQVSVFEIAPPVLRAVSVRLGGASTVTEVRAVLEQPTLLVPRTVRVYDPTARPLTVAVLALPELMSEPSERLKV